MSGEEGEEPRPANIYIHGLISIVREGDQRAGWLECGKLGRGEGDNVESLSHSLTHTHTTLIPASPNVQGQGLGESVAEGLGGLWAL